MPSTGAAAVVPPFDTSWDVTGAAVMRMVTAKTNTAASTIGNGFYGTAKIAIRRYVSDPLAVQTISGTVKAILRAYDYAASTRVFPQVSIRVVSRDGQTIRGTLLPIVQAPTQTSLDYYLINRKFPYYVTTGPTLTNVTTQLGDRIEVWVGLYANAAYTPLNGIEFGDTAADLAENETGTTAGSPWIEFSGDVTFEGGGSVSPVIDPGAGPVPVGTVSSTVKARTRIPWELYLCDIYGAPLVDITDIATKVEITVARNAPTRLSFEVPSDSPKIAALHTDGKPLLSANRRTVKAYRQELGGANVVTNPSFEVDTSTWTTVNGTITRDVAKASMGAASGKLVATATTAEMYTSPSADVGGLRLGMVPGSTYQWSVDVYVPAGFGVALADVTLQIYDYASGGYQATASPAPTAFNTWQTLTVTRTIRAGATEAFPRVQVTNVTSGMDTVSIDNAKLADPAATSWVLRVAANVVTVGDSLGQSARTAAVCFDPLYHLARRVVRDANGARGDRFTATPPGRLLTILIDNANRLGPLSTGIQTIGALIPALSARTVDYSETKTIGAALADLVQSINSFDVYLGPIERLNGDLTRLIMYAPAQGVAKPDITLGWKVPPYNVSEMVIVEDGAKQQNVSVSVGDGVSAEASDTASQTTYGWIEQTEQYDDVGDASFLTDKTAQALQPDPPRFVQSVKPIPGLVAEPWTQFFIGDLIGITAHASARGGINTSMTVESFTVTVDGGEKLTNLQAKE